MNIVFIFLFLNFVLLTPSIKAARRQIQNLHLSPLEKSVIYSPVVIKCLVRQAKTIRRAKEFIACGIVQEILKNNSRKVPSRICLTWDSNRRLRWKPEEHISVRVSYIFSLKKDLSAHYTAFQATDAALKEVREILRDCPSSVANTFPKSCGKFLCCPFATVFK